MHTMPVSGGGDIMPWHHWYKRFIFKLLITTKLNALFRGLGMWSDGNCLSLLMPWGLSSFLLFPMFSPSYINLLPLVYLVPGKCVRAGCWHQIPLSWLAHQSVICSSTCSFSLTCPWSAHQASVLKPGLRSHSLPNCCVTVCIMADF